MTRLTLSTFGRNIVPYLEIILRRKEIICLSREDWAVKLRYCGFSHRKLHKYNVLGLFRSVPNLEVIREKNMLSIKWRDGYVSRYETDEGDRIGILESTPVKE